jgi:hypothetical protein
LKNVPATNMFVTKGIPPTISKKTASRGYKKNFGTGFTSTLLSSQRTTTHPKRTPILPAHTPGILTGRPQRRSRPANTSGSLPVAHITRLPLPLQTEPKPGRTVTPSGTSQGRRTTPPA